MASGRPYHLYPLLGLVLIAAMAIGLYIRIKYPPKPTDIREKKT